jgi:hypothetical protein
MHAHRERVTITEEHEVKVSLPQDFPAGDAEVIVIAEGRLGPAIAGDPSTDFDDWLDTILSQLPPAPTVPLEALRRENLYEDD